MGEMALSGEEDVRTGVQLFPR